MYQEFAVIYDEVMSEIPYDRWFEKLHACMGEYGKEAGHVCELGCGTGEMSRRFSAVGYEVTGIDLSVDMLARAMEKREEGQKLIYVNQDMSHFSLHKPADVVLCICDSMNYVLDHGELLDLFRSVRANLADNGIFVFDLKTEYCFRTILGDRVRFEDDERYSVIWENVYDQEEKLNQYLLTMFFHQETSGLYERYDECHTQRAYSLGEINGLLRQSGLEVYACYGADFVKAPEEEDERIYFVVGKDAKDV